MLVEQNLLLFKVFLVQRLKQSGSTVVLNLQFQLNDLLFIFKPETFDFIDDFGLG